MKTHCVSSVHMAPSSAHCSNWGAAAGAMQTAQGAVGDPPAKQPGLPMFPSFCSELLPLKWAVVTGPAATLGPYPGKWNTFILITPRPPDIWLCLQLSTVFDAIGRAANFAAAVPNSWLEPNVLVCWTNQMKNSIWMESAVPVTTLNGKINILLQPLP